MHPSTRALLWFFEFDHLPEPLQAVAMPFCVLAYEVAEQLPDSPETTVCVRKLLEAKDCAVRAAL